MRTFIAGLLLGLLAVPLAVFLYFKLGNPPVAIADPPLPFERNIVAVPLNARIDRELVKTAPLEASEATFSAAAPIYRTQCAFCHGVPGAPTPFATAMFPRAPQLFVQHGDHTGVSDDEPGETYWKIANGIRLSGMPSYAKILDERSMWQVALLLANADKLSPAVQAALQASSPGSSAPPQAPPPQPSTPAKAGAR